MSVNRVSRNSRSNTKNPSPLAGKVFDEDGTPLTPEHAKKGTRRYRYYCRRDGGLRVSAQELERCATQAIAENRDVRLAIANQGITRGPSLDLVERLILKGGRVSIDLQINGEPITIEAPFTRKKRGVEHKLVLSPGDPRAPDQTLIKRIGLAMSWLDQMKAGASIKEVAETSSVTPEYITHNLDLAFLSPSVQRAILEGRQSPDVSAYQLSKISIPPLWSDQTDLFLPN